MTQRFELKKRLLGGYSVVYDCPHCKCGLKSSLDEAGLKDTCPECGRTFVVPGSVDKERVRNEHQERERERQEKSESKRKQMAKEKAKRKLDKAAYELADEIPPITEAFKPEKPPVATQASDKTRTCPYCAEQILAAAKKCKHCGEFLDKSVQRERQKAQGNDGCSQIIVIALGIVLAILLLMII